MDWTKKLTSRKFWLALACLVVGVLALFKIDADTTTQISGVIMSLGAVVAYIVGEGLVDSAAVGTSGSSAVPQYTGQAVGNVEDTAAKDAVQTGAARAAEVKADTAESVKSVFPGISNVTLDQIDTAIKAANIARGNTSDSVEQEKLTLSLSALNTLRTAKVAASGTAESGTADCTAAQ